MPESSLLRGTLPRAGLGLSLALSRTFDVDLPTTYLTSKVLLNSQLADFTPYMTLFRGELGGLDYLRVLWNSVEPFGVSECLKNAFMNSYARDIAKRP